MREALESARLDFHNGLDKLDRTIAEANPPAAPVALRRIVLDALNEVAPAVENLATHQEQCDFDGVMVKVSRQALYEVLNAINEVAIQAAITSPAPVDAGVREALIDALAGLKYIEPAIPVLRTMFMTADLALGARKAEEMDASNKEAIKKLEAVLAALSSQPVVGVDQEEIQTTMPKPQQNI